MKTCFAALVSMLVSVGCGDAEDRSHDTSACRPETVGTNAPNGFVPEQGVVSGCTGEAMGDWLTCCRDAGTR